MGGGFEWASAGSRPPESRTHQTSSRDKKNMAVLDIDGDMACGRGYSSYWMIASRRRSGFLFLRPATD